MPMRFNTPPGWPPAPHGWQPPPGWQPDPAWGPAPPGWQFWIDDPMAPPLAATAAPRRSTGRTVLGIILIVLGALFVLGMLSSIARGSLDSPRDGAELIGYVIGMLLFPIGFLVAGILVLRRPRR